MFTSISDNNIQFYFRLSLLPLQIFDLLQFAALKYAPVMFSPCEVINSFLCRLLVVEESCMNRVFKVMICLLHFKLNVECTTLHPLFGNVYLAFISY